MTNACAIIGASGSGKTTLFEALRQLRMIARGASAAAGYGVWSETDFSELAVSIALPDGRLATYVAKVQQVGLVANVVSETLSAGRTMFLRREGFEFVFDQNGLDGTRVASRKYSISGSTFALGFLRADGSGDPIMAMKRCLSNVWLLMPDPNAMIGLLDAALPAEDMACRFLASYFVSRQQVLPTLYAAVMANMAELCAGITGFSVERDNFGGRHLAVHRASDVNSHGMEMGTLSQGEKLCLLTAFVSAVNVLSGPIACFWDSPLNWLDKKTGAKMIQMLWRSFRVHGQIVVLSPECDEVKCLGKVARI